jgi:hypothetical protein
LTKASGPLPPYPLRFQSSCFRSERLPHSPLSFKSRKGQKRNANLESTVPNADRTGLPPKKFRDYQRVKTGADSRGLPVLPPMPPGTPPSPRRECRPPPHSAVRRRPDMARDAREEGDVVTAELLFVEAMRYFDKGNRVSERWRNFEALTRALRIGVRRPPERRNLLTPQIKTKAGASLAPQGAPGRPLARSRERGRPLGG